jgi:uncharacterized RDD family membrane protein YckC
MTSENGTIAPPLAAPHTAREGSATSTASIRARIGGYAVDMVILAAISMLASIGALFLLLFATDFAEQDPSDATLAACFAVLFAGVPAIWSALNIGLLLARRQTGGQYVAALRLAREDGNPLTLQTVCTWWFCGNPLLFSWLMIGVAGVPLLAAAALAPGDVALAVPIFVILLAAVLPIVAVISALLDPRNRALHDRIAGVIVVPD